MEIYDLATKVKNIFKVNNRIKVSGKYKEWNILE